MITVLIVALGVGALLVGLYLWAKSVWRKACRQGAEKIYDELTRNFGVPHAVVEVRPEDFPDVPREGYALVGEFLTRRGMRLLGHIEDTTISGIYPQNRTWMSTYVSEDGLVCAVTYAIQGVQILDLGSALEDGRFLLTTNAEKNKLTPPPGLLRKVHSPQEPLEVLFSEHNARVEALKEAEPHAAWLPVRALADVIKISADEQALLNAHRREIGLLTEEELLSMMEDPGQEATARQVWREFTRVRAARQGASP